MIVTLLLVTVQPVELLSNIGIDSPCNKKYDGDIPYIYGQLDIILYGFNVGMLKLMLSLPSKQNRHSHVYIYLPKSIEF